MGSSFGIISQTGNNIQTEGLVFYVDAAYKKSYPRTGTSIFNIASGSLTPTGSFEGAPTFVSSPPSLDFDGSDDYVKLANNTTLQVATDNHSLFFWMKTSDGSTQVVMEKGSGNNELAAWVISNKIQWAGSNAFLSSTSVNDGNWKHIAFIADGSNSYIYINSSLDQTGSTKVKGSANTSTFTFGARDGGSFAFDGNLSLIQVYNRALSASDVLQNYQAQKGRFGL